MNFNCCGPKTFTPSPCSFDDAWFAELEKKKREAYNRLDGRLSTGKTCEETDEIIRNKLSPSDFSMRFYPSPRSKSTMEEIDLADEIGSPKIEDLREFLGLSPAASPGVSPSNSLTPRSPRDIPRSEAMWISNAIQDTKLDLAIPAHRERLNDWDVKEKPTAGTSLQPRIYEDPETHTKSVLIRASEEEPEEEFIILEDDEKGSSVPTAKKPRFWRIRTRSDISLNQVETIILPGPKRHLFVFVQ